MNFIRKHIKGVVKIFKKKKAERPTYKVGDKIRFIGNELPTFREGEIDTIIELPNDDLDNGRLFRLKNRTIHKDWLYGCESHPPQFENLTKETVINNWEEEI